MGLDLFLISIVNGVIFIIIPFLLLLLLIRFVCPLKYQKILKTCCCITALCLFGFVFGWFVVEDESRYSRTVDYETPGVQVMRVRAPVTVYQDFDLTVPVFELTPQDQCRGFLNDYFLSVSLIELFSDKYLVSCEHKGVGWVSRDGNLSDMPYPIERLMIKILVFSIFLILSYFVFCIGLSLIESDHEDPVSSES